MKGVVICHNRYKRRRIDGKLYYVDGPSVVSNKGNLEWWLHSNRHRQHGPAIICANGNREWWCTGKRHRLDGPAVEFTYGKKEWYLWGQLYRQEEYVSAMEKKRLVCTQVKTVTLIDLLKFCRTRKFSEYFYTCSKRRLKTS
jgi:hypothetical protein